MIRRAGNLFAAFQVQAICFTDLGDFLPQLSDAIFDWVLHEDRLAGHSRTNSFLAEIKLWPTCQLRQFRVSSRPSTFNLKDSGVLYLFHVRVNSVIRILVADDFEAWRVRVRHLLKAQPEWQIVTEAADGTEAIRKTIEMRPDVVLLDLSMPHVSGLEAAETILKSLPEVRIIFLTMNNDKEVMGAALAMGAKGYVLKANAGRELLPTISRVLLGRPFVPESG